MTVTRENSTIIHCFKAVCTVKSADDPMELTIMSLKERLEMALQNENVQKALHAIRQAEHNHASEKDIDDSQTYWIYNGRIRLQDQNDHPANKPGAQKRSTPAGAYQIIVDTWNGAKRKMELTDFCAHSQDLAALYIINNEGKLTNIEKGKFLESSTLGKLAVQWAALPKGKGLENCYSDQKYMQWETLKIHYDHYL